MYIAMSKPPTVAMSKPLAIHVAAGVYCAACLGTVIYSARQMDRRNKELGIIAANSKLEETAKSRHEHVIRWFQRLDDKLGEK